MEIMVESNRYLKHVKIYILPKIFISHHADCSFRIGFIDPGIL